MSAHGMPDFVIAGAMRELADILAMAERLADDVRTGGYGDATPLQHQARLANLIDEVWEREAMPHVIAAMIINSVETDIKDISGIYGNTDLS
jgi:hypothetical protein